MDPFDRFVSYIPLVILALGLTFNTITFFIFRYDKSLNYLSLSVYLSFMSITDTLSLLTFNLNHFLVPNFDIAVDYLNWITCRIFSFLQFFSWHASGFLLCIISIDRYFIVTSIPGSFFQEIIFSVPKDRLLSGHYLYLVPRSWLIYIFYCLMVTKGIQIWILQSMISLLVRNTLMKSINATTTHQQ